jgi:hypothetical protein
MDQDITASNDDLKLLQIYLCRLYLTSGYEHTLSLFNTEQSLTFLGIKPPEDADALSIHRFNQYSGNLKSKSSRCA